MKGMLTCAAVASLLVGCVTTETGTVSSTRNGTRAYGLDDQPQSSVAGTGSLMPGAYDNRQMQTGQFTGRERTNDMIGQSPTLPREADARELARSEQSNRGAGTLGQSGVVPDQDVSNEVIIESSTPALPSAAGNAPASEAGRGSDTTNSIGAPPATQRPE